jgi:protein ImuB
MERLGGDAGVAQALLRAAQSAGYAKARVGVASTCIAAALATRERGSAWRIVPPAREVDFIARRPLAWLPMPPSLFEDLHRLGLSSCRELAAFPAAEVELLFGAEGLALWRLCQGDDPRWPFRPQAPDTPVAELEFEPAIEGVEPLRFVLPGLVEAIVRQTAHRQRLPESYRLVLITEEAEERAVAVRPARPTGETRVILDLARLALEAEQLGARIAAVRLEAVGWSASQAEQLDAFEAAAPDPSAVLSALSGVLARWGEGAICQAVPHGAHLPSRAAVWESPGPAAVHAILHAPSTPRAPVGSGAVLTLCPHRLDRPEPVRVEVDAAGLPVSVWRAGSRYGVAADGPERLSGEWWGEPYALDLYLAAAEQGPLWLLARDARTNTWQLEGWYD